jgi:hypothetical protein
MDDIFMHIGNITELILTGNEISTTRGLDRIFSLELLSLDENKIQQLTHISAIAKMPFLMNFDLKGNPFEIDGEMFLVNDYLILPALNQTHPLLSRFRSCNMPCSGLQSFP